MARGHTSNSSSTGNGGIRGPYDEQHIAWSPDQSMLALRANWEVVTNDPVVDHGACIIDIANQTATRVAQSVPGGDAYKALFSADNSRVYIRGDMAVDGEVEIFGTADFSTADQTLTNILIKDVAAASNSTLGLVIAP